MTLLSAVIVASCSGDSSPAGPGSTVLTPDRIGGAWTLQTLQTPGQPETAPPAGSLFTVEVAADRAAIRADCNRCSGLASVGGTTVTVGPNLACTRAYCSSSPFDDTFVKVLSGESTAAIEGDTLVLRADRGVLRFRR